MESDYTALGYFLGGLLISLEAGQKKHDLSEHNVVCELGTLGTTTKVYL